MGGPKKAAARQGRILCSPDPGSCSSAAAIAISHGFSQAFPKGPPLHAYCDAQIGCAEGTRVMQVLHCTSASARMRGERNASQQALLRGQRREINRLLAHSVTPLQASSAPTLPSSIRIPEIGGVLGAGTCCGTIRCRKGGLLLLPDSAISAWRLS